MSIEAMKQALEALENAQHFIDEYAAAIYIYAHNAAVISLRQAIAEESSATQEPVGWMQLSAIFENMVVPVVPVELPVGTKLYTHPQPKAEQEPKREP